MTSTRTYNGITLDIVRADTERICYILLPEGLKDEGRKWMEKASGEFGVTIVVMSGMDWNDSLTPWVANGVFREAKPFGGNAAAFLTELTQDIIPQLEQILGLASPGCTPDRHLDRYMVGISLSGLFALWSAFNCDFFDGIASISGSLWYDGFAEWAECHSLSPAVSKIFISLGDREKHSRDRRMATVEEKTLQVVEALRSNGISVEFALEENTTHFSPLLPRLEKVFKALLTPFANSK